ncbi:hypothetical protein EJ07DRAFT_106173, partial [Lizonia empirigonia]
VSKRQGWAIILHRLKDRRHHNLPSILEKKGRLPKISNKGLRKIDRLLQEERFKASSLS